MKWPLPRLESPLSECSQIASSSCLIREPLSKGFHNFALHLWYPEFYALVARSSSSWKQRIHLMPTKSVEVWIGHWCHLYIASLNHSSLSLEQFDEGHWHSEVFSQHKVVLVCPVILYTYAKQCWSYWMLVPELHGWSEYHPQWWAQTAFSKKISIQAFSFLCIVTLYC